MRYEGEVPAVENLDPRIRSIGTLSGTSILKSRSESIGTRVGFAMNGSYGLANGAAGTDERGASSTTGRIRSAIIAGEFSPNERLIEADLAERFETSRGEIRSALVELTGEGLVERETNRGARVRALSRDEAIEICELRGLIEGLCAAKAAEHITDEESDELYSLLGIMAARVEQDDVAWYCGLDVQLHRRIAEIAKRPMAAAIIRRLQNQSVRPLFRVGLVPKRIEVSLGEHRAVVDAIVAHDAASAERLMHAHIAKVMGVMESIEPHGIR